MDSLFFFGCSRHSILCAAIDKLETYKEPPFDPRTITSLPLAAACLSQDGRVKDCNDAFCKMFQYPHEKLINATVFALVHSAHLVETLRAVQSLITGHISVWERDTKCVNGAGQAMDVHVTFSIASDKPRCLVLLVVPSASNVVPQMPVSSVFAWPAG